MEVIMLYMTSSNNLSDFFQKHLDVHIIINLTIRVFQIRILCKDFTSPIFFEL